MSGMVLQGIGLTMTAGVMSGNCMLPMKFARRWRWENIWLVFVIVSLLILPWALAFAEVNRFLEVYRVVPVAVMYAPLLFGAGWGVAQILFGISVRRLGMGVGYAIIVGLGAVFGTLVPLFVGQRRFVSGVSLAEILAGVMVMVSGIVLTAWGGQVREHAGSETIAAHSQEQGYLAAVLLAVLCGVLAPMLNYAFAFGQGLALAAVRLGNSPAAAAYAVWPVALLGGFLPNFAYSVYLLHKNRSWATFVESGADGMWAALMGVLWVGAISLYGVAAVYLGPLGTSIGWGLLQIFMIMAATMSGLLTAEWKNASRRAMMLMSMGMAGLIGATVLLSMGSH
ncbi:MAG TPA: L-rhamnose/proton symporter RhaT [Granulicella sp.]|jgi:L-rhamnose-H+ transport protein|nr:L-rhamnose/proton symporter RhaT [Granulicella sp.]